MVVSVRLLHDSELEAPLSHSVVLQRITESKETDIIVLKERFGYVIIDKNDNGFRRNGLIRFAS